MSQLMSIFQIRPELAIRYQQNLVLANAKFNFPFLKSEGWLVSSDPLYTKEFIWSLANFPHMFVQLFALVKNAMNVLDTFSLEERIFATYEFVDTINQQVTNISCRKGCSACCHQRVGLHHGEAEIIAKRVEHFDKEQLLKLAAWEENDERWSSTKPKERVCPFLKDGCSASYLSFESTIL
jgi:hypothetical protein